MGVHIITQETIDAIINDLLESDLLLREIANKNNVSTTYVRKINERYACRNINRYGKDYVIPEDNRHEPPIIANGRRWYFF